MDLSPRPAFQAVRALRCIVRFIAEPAVLVLAALLGIYFAADFALYLAAPIIAAGVMSYFGSFVRKRYKVDEEPVDPTKPERFYH